MRRPTMKYNNEPRLRNVLEKKRGAIKDVSGRNRIEMFWDYDNHMKEHAIFRLHVTGEDGKTHEMLIPKEQLMHYLRCV